LGKVIVQVALLIIFYYIAIFPVISTNIHVVGMTALCWALWKLRNRAYFEKKLIKSPAEIMCYACFFL
jgi:hypothetical protein